MRISNIAALVCRGGAIAWLHHVCSRVRGQDGPAAAGRWRSQLS